MTALMAVPGFYMVRHDNMYGFVLLAPILIIAILTEKKEGEKQLRLRAALPEYKQKLRTKNLAYERAVLEIGLLPRERSLFAMAVDEDHDEAMLFHFKEKNARISKESSEAIAWLVGIFGVFALVMWAGIASGFFTGQ